MRDTVIWTISLPPQMAQKAEEAARRESRTRSELVREALRQYMAAREWEHMQARASSRAREMGVLSESDVEDMIDTTRN
ncbi:MAG: ribbon-helix-helix protein, CopG family [Clostridia bacterium]|nr:ribbon-helix-helix protein, CopG family [Clostridia bacterium]